MGRNHAPNTTTRSSIGVNWSPDLFAQFEKRRGYRLQTELPALFGKETNDHVARVKCDYRETMSDMMIEDSMPLWFNWCRERGFLTRNQAHGSPGNLLDLYALADIPETEMFHTDRRPLVSKFASSAAHVAGKQAGRVRDGHLAEGTLHRDARRRARSARRPVRLRHQPRHFPRHLLLAR